MEKISTLFTRAKNGRVTDILSDHVTPPSVEWLATEKLDGANVRLTVRSGQLVRLEARRNPTRIQKEDGIVHPWYRDAQPEEQRNSDYWLWNAARNTPLMGVPDGEWSGEAVGPKIQGNPLGLKEHVVFLFSLLPWRETLSSTIPLPPVIENAPLSFDELADWLPGQRSQVNKSVNIEGVVWWFFVEPVAKIIVKDF